jgi:hypothetical protein
MLAPPSYEPQTKIDRMILDLQEEFKKQAKLSEERDSRLKTIADGLAEFGFDVHDGMVNAKVWMAKHQEWTESIDIGLARLD